MSDLTDKELLDALGVETKQKKQVARTPREARIIAGFEDIQNFVSERGCPPAHGEDRDIFERLYAVRLDRLRGLEEGRKLLVDMDQGGLLGDVSVDGSTGKERLDDEVLLAQLGVGPEAGTGPDDDISTLKHVKSRAEVRAAEEIANRDRCKDFEHFKPLFEQVREDLDSGARETRRFQKDASVSKGEFFIVGGQVAYVAHVGEEERRTTREVPDHRLRVIYDNGTESDILLRSLQRALYKDEAGRRITDPTAGPLFGSAFEDEDIESGSIYVLRSSSDHPLIAQNRDVIHKIGVTGGDVEARIASSKKDATFLFADVKLVAKYKLANINRARLENLLHRFFAPARLDIQMEDRFGQPVKPREWFLVPLDVIDEVVDRVRDKTLTQYQYNPSTASIEKRAGGIVE